MKTLKIYSVKYEQNNETRTMTYPTHSFTKGSALRITKEHHPNAIVHEPVEKEITLKF